MTEENSVAREGGRKREKRRKRGGEKDKRKEGEKRIRRQWRNAEKVKKDGEGGAATENFFHRAREKERELTLFLSSLLLFIYFLMF